jgi:hypothetical protein
MVKDEARGSILTSKNPPRDPHQRRGGRLLEAILVALVWVHLEVHHNTYERYGDESTFDLIVLCEQCHELFHGIVEDAL